MRNIFLLMLISSIPLNIYANVQKLNVKYSIYKIVASSHYSSNPEFVKICNKAFEEFMDTNVTIKSDKSEHIIYATVYSRMTDSKIEVRLNPWSGQLDNEDVDQDVENEYGKQFIMQSVSVNLPSRKATFIAAPKKKSDRDKFFCQIIASSY